MKKKFLFLDNCENPKNFMMEFCENKEIQRNSSNANKKMKYPFSMFSTIGKSLRLVK